MMPLVSLSDREPIIVYDLPEPAHTYHTSHTHISHTSHASHTCLAIGKYACIVAIESIVQNVDTKSIKHDVLTGIFWIGGVYRPEAMVKCKCLLCARVRSLRYLRYFVNTTYLRLFLGAVRGSVCVCV